MNTAHLPGKKQKREKKKKKKKHDFHSFKPQISHLSEFLTSTFSLLVFSQGCTTCSVTF